MKQKMWYIGSGEDGIAEIIEATERPKTISNGGKYTMLTSGYPSKEGLIQGQCVAGYPCSECGGVVCLNGHTKENEKRDKHSTMYSDNCTTPCIKKKKRLKKERDMITEKEADAFAEKAKQDALKAFNELLSTHKLQQQQISDLKQKHTEARRVYEKWALDAGYKVDWDKYTAEFHKMIGDCMECKRKGVGLQKYSDFKGGYMVCDNCYDCLHNQLDNYEN